MPTGALTAIAPAGRQGLKLTGVDRDRVAALEHLLHVDEDVTGVLFRVGSVRNGPTLDDLLIRAWRCRFLCRCHWMILF